MSIELTPPSKGMVYTRVCDLDVWSWPVAPIDEPAQARHTTVRAFFDRADPLKWSILEDQDAGMPAVIEDASLRNYIDLNDSDLPAGLAMMQAAGHAIDPDVVIDREVMREERP